MSILPIYTYDQSVLRKKAKPVKTVDDEFVRFVEDMFETMHQANGIGLAANQVGSLERVIVVDVSETLKEREESDAFDDEIIPPEARAPLVMINPVVTAEEGTFVMEEGCLSIPDIREEVKRAETIHIKYKDLQMQDKKLVADGLLARVILHEVDHLNGILFIDRLGKMRQKLLKGRLNKIRRGEIEVKYPVVIDTVEVE